MSARPQLQLVVGAADLEPISPELVLVTPELAEVARAALPDPPWLRPDLAAGGRSAEPLRPVRAATPAEPPTAQPATPARVWGFFDTADRRLEWHGISLERHGGATARWRLVLGRGETIEADEEAAGAPPAAIVSLLRSVVGSQPLIPVPWHADDPAVIRLQQEIRDQLRALVRHDPDTRLAADPENLHQLRVATRRLRAFLRVGRMLVDREWADAVRTELSVLGRAGGPVRDLDVLLARVECGAAQLEGREQPAARSLVAALESERERLRQALRSALDEPGYDRLLEQLALPMHVSPTPVRVSLRKLARRELRKLVRDVRKVGDAPTDTDLHALRIRVKRARYAVELAGGSNPRADSLLASARAVQAILGEHQDTVVAERLLFEQATQVHDAAVAFVAGRLAEREHGRREDLRQRLPHAWRQLRRAARRF